MTSLLALAWRLNARHFLARRLRGALTVAGIAGGVALVFSIAAINSTLFDTVRSSIRDVAGAAELEVSGPAPNSLSQATQERLQKVDGVSQAVPVLRVTSTVREGKKSARAMFLGVTPAFRDLFPGGEEMVRLAGDFGAGAGVVLAEDLAGRLGLSEGDDVRVETPGGVRSVPMTGTVAGPALRAVNGGDVALMFLPAAQALFEKETRVDAVYLVLDPGASREQVQAAAARVVPSGIAIGDPELRSRSFDSTLQSVTALTSLAAVVALFVAVFVVYNTVSVSLAERRRDIAMSLALGATRLQLAGAFLLEALLLGSLAGVLGIGVGFAVAAVLLDQAAAGYQILLPVGNVGSLVVTPAHLLLGMSSSILVSVVGTIVPVRKVLGISAVEALRPSAQLDLDGGSTAQVAGPVVGATLIAAVAAAVLLLEPTFTWVVAVATLLPLMFGVTLLLPWAVRLALQLLTPLVRKGGVPGRLASDALQQNLRRTTLTVGALVMTAALVVGVAGALESMKSEVARRTRVWFFAPLYVTADSYTGFTSDQPLRRSLRPRLEGVPGVAHALPQRYGVGSVAGEQTVMYGVSTTEAREEGVVAKLPREVRAYWDEVLANTRPDAVAISHYTADAANVGIGDDVEVVTPRGRRSFEVVALFDDLAPFNTMYIELETYARLWNDRSVDRFSIFPEEGVSIEEVAGRLRDELDRADAPARVQTSTQVGGEVLEFVEGTWSLARGVQLAAMLIAALTIANTMLIAVLERRWEFGLQRALGMSLAQLGRSIVMEATLIGFIGAAGAGLLGVLLGAAMTRLMEVQFTWSIPFAVPLATIAGVGAGSIAIAVAAALYPRAVALRAPIIDSLRYE